MKTIGRLCKTPGRWLACLAWGALALAPAAPAAAQFLGGNALPRETYFIAMTPFHQGEYRTALQAFQREYRAGLQSPEGRWLDSVCYHTMIGECFYQMGDLDSALTQFESALQLAVAHNGWMLRVQQWPTINNNAAITTTQQRNRPTWGATQRQTAPAKMSDTMTVSLGIAPQFVQGSGGATGVAAAPVNRIIIGGEVVRCTALALRRYGEILGPAARYMPLSAQVLDAFSRRPAPANHWSQAWMSAQLGLAQSVMGQRQQAVAELQKSLVIGSDLDHLLTPTALLELGKLAIAEDRLPQAAVFFMEATYAGAVLEQPDVIEEAFRHAAALHAATNQAGTFDPLINAAQWTVRQRSYVQLRASLLALAAESLAERGQTAGAATHLADAEKVMGRREMAAGAVGARWQRVAALISYQQGNIAEGDKRLAALTAWQRKGSTRLAHVAAADRLYVSDAVSPRIASDLFAEALREPTAKDWALDPQGTLSTVMTPLLTPMEHWFESAMARKEPKTALEIADRVRRRRFYSSLPMGGRLLSLRWVLEAPAAMLDQQTLLQRQDLLARYPGYANLSRQSAEARAALAALPLTVDKGNREVSEQQRKLFAQWQKTALAQEALLREMAMRRGPSDFVFPPLRTTDAIQAALAPDEGALVFFATSRYVLAFAVDQNDVAHWQIESPREVTTRVANMLKAMGHFDRNQAVDGKLLRDDRWKAPAAEILEYLTAKAPAGLLDRWKRLAIVPDSVLWHVPFEALPRDTADGQTLLVDSHRVRYLPTAGLLAGDGRGAPAATKSAVIVGKLFPREGDSLTANAAEEIKRVSPGTQRLDELPGPSNLVAALADRLIVLDDIDDADRLPYDWSPAQLDKVTLSQWMGSPWGACQQLLLPGFHTAAETGLKRSAAGDDVFLTVCGMLASGVRTALISRWRTGGQSSVDLTREFVQELPFVRPDDAWQRSVTLVRHNALDPDLEPRVKLTEPDPTLTCDHPFLWSGYLLIDLVGAAPGHPN